MLVCMERKGLVMGPFKCYVTQWGGVGVSFPRKKRCEGVQFNVISVTGGGANFEAKSLTCNT